jgi:chromosome segregation ATPase
MLANAVEDSIGKTNSLCEVLKEEIAVCDVRIAGVAAMLRQLAQVNELAEERLAKADTMLEELLEKNDEVQEKIAAVRGAIRTERALTRALGICGSVIIALLFIRLFFV